MRTVVYLTITFQGNKDSNIVKPEVELLMVEEHIGNSREVMALLGVPNGSHRLLRSRSKGTVLDNLRLGRVVLLGSRGRIRLLMRRLLRGTIRCRLREVV